MKFTSFSSSDIIEISGAIKCILHGAGDWDGGRKERMVKEEPESAHPEKRKVNYPNDPENSEEASSNSEGKDVDDSDDNVEGKTI